MPIFTVWFYNVPLGETECDGQTDVWLLYPICTKPYCVRLQMSDWALQVASARPYCAVLLIFL
jgi:hypothetical protein